MAKLTFSRGDVIAINGRMVSKSGTFPEARYAPTPTKLSHAPSSPVAAKVMRALLHHPQTLQSAESAFASKAPIKGHIKAPLAEHGFKEQLPSRRVLATPQSMQDLPIAR